MTKKRRRILEFFRTNEEPLSAQQLYEQMEDSPDRATIYRALKYLEESGEIVSFIMDCSLRGVERYYSLRNEEHRHYMHCVSCHGFTVLKTCPLDSLKSVAQETGFRIEEHLLTLKGVCSECRKD